MKVPFFLSLFLIGFYWNSLCQIPIGKYSSGGVFSNQTLELQENNQFEYYEGSCEGGSYGKGSYEVDGDLICLYFHGPERDLEETKITRFDKSRDSLVVYFTDKFKKLKWLEFSYLTNDHERIDTVLKMDISNFIRLPKSYLPVKFVFFTSGLLDCPITFRKTGKFLVEVSVTKELIAKKQDYDMLYNKNIVYHYSLFEKSKLNLKCFGCKLPLNLNKQ